MLRSAILWAVLALSAGPILPPARAVGLSVEGNLTCPCHKMARLKATGYQVGSAIVWDVSPDDKADLAEVGDQLLLTGPPGSYVVKARAIKLDGARTIVESARVTVTILAPPAPAAPAAPPAPKPDAPKPDAPKPDPKAATCKIVFGRAGCTASVVWPRRADGRWDLVTAAHCVAGAAKKGKCYMRSGRVLDVEVTAVDAKADVAWLVTATKEDSLPYVVLATACPPVGTRVWHNGFGVDRPGNVESGTVAGAEAADRQIPFRLSVSSGDSGGGIFIESTGELLATVCCTKARGRLAPMWGGSAMRAAEIRPK